MKKLRFFSFGLMNFKVDKKSAFVEMVAYLRDWQKFMDTWTVLYF